MHKSIRNWVNNLSCSFKLAFKYNLVEYGSIFNFTLLSILKPLSGVLAFVIMTSFVSNSESIAFSLASYMVTGSLLLIFIHRVLWGMSTELSKEKRIGTLPAIFVTPASRTAWLLGKVASFLVGGFMELFALGALWALAGIFHVDIANLLAVAISFALMLFCFIGFGYVISCLDFVSRSESWLSNLIQPAIVALCGIYYAPSLDVIPLPLFYLSHTVLAPITISVETTRNAILGLGSFNTLLVPWIVMFVLGAFLLFIGRCLFSVVESLLKKRATLEYH